MKKLFLIALLTAFCQFASHSQSFDMTMYSIADLDMFIMQTQLQMQNDTDGQSDVSAAAVVNGGINCQINVVGNVISITNDKPMALIQLYDVAGRLLHQSPEGTHTTAYTILAPGPGVYIVRIAGPNPNPDYVYNEKVVIPKTK